jgi:hypothetical protein
VIDQLLPYIHPAGGGHSKATLYLLKLRQVALPALVNICLQLPVDGLEWMFHRNWIKRNMVKGFL